MNTTTILKKGEGLLLWIYTSITNKFTKVFKKLTDKFPVLNRYPLLKYSLIPLLLALFFTARYIIKFLIDELAVWSSGILGETSGFIISENVIVLTIAAMFIALRLIMLFNKQKKEKAG